MTRPGILLRLALRDARHDLARLGLCAVLVGVAVAVGVTALASVSHRSSANLRVEAQRVPGARLASPSVRFWDRRQIVLRGGGRELQIDKQPHTAFDVQERAVDGSAVTVPRGSRVSAFGAAPLSLIGNRRLVEATAVDASLRGGPAAAGVRIAAGRVPASIGEVALDGDLARRLRVGVGDSVQDGRRRLRVVGLLEQPVRLAADRSADAVLAPGALSGASGGWVEWLVRVPDRSNLLAPGLHAGGLSAHARLDADPPARRSGGELVAAGFAEAAALIIPLFIVGAVLAMGVERRVRERALLALAGAGPGALRTLEALRGALIGTGGAVVGIVLAAAFAAAAGRDLELTAGAVLVPGSVALITSAWALTLSAQTARVRLGAIQSVPGLPPWSLVQRELARGGGLLAGRSWQQ